MRPAIDSSPPHKPAKAMQTGGINAVAKERRRREVAKEDSVLREKLQKLNAQYKAEKLELEVSVKAHSTAASAAEAENRHLNTEVKRLCKLTECLKRRITELENELATRPDLTLRTRIKLLCRKYHADKCGEGAAFTGEEVSRDLVALLSDEYGVR